VRVDHARPAGAEAEARPPARARRVDARRFEHDVIAAKAADAHPNRLVEERRRGRDRHARRRPTRRRSSLPRGDGRADGYGDDRRR
jgi:hypothetical protein